MARGMSEGIAEQGELFRTHIGGSALVEGVMMRGRLSWAVAARMPDGGIYLEEHEIAGGGRQAWRSWPIVRGCIAFVESMVLSVRAMAIATDHVYDRLGETFASLVAGGKAFWSDRARTASSGPAAGRILSSDEDGPTLAGRERPVRVDGSAVPASAGVGVSGEGGPELVAVTLGGSADAGGSVKRSQGDSAGMSGAGMAASIVSGVLLGVALFVALPVAVANLVVGDYSTTNSLAWNLVEAAVRVALFVAYIWGIGRIPEMARVFGYHGAEHLSIHCFEHGLPLTPANAARFSRLHVRCGTAFLIMTMLVAIVVNTLVPVASLADAWGLGGLSRAGLVFVSRLVLVPLVAGVSYEVTVKWAGSHPESPLVRVVLWPGLQMQRLTTRVPDEGMLECAIAALRCVREREERAGIAAGEPCCD